VSLFTVISFIDDTEAVSETRRAGAEESEATVTAPEDAVDGDGEGEGNREDERATEAAVALLAATVRLLNIGEVAVVVPTLNE
jgi:hypothetical protein